MQLNYAATYGRNKSILNGRANVREWFKRFPCDDHLTALKFWCEAEKAASKEWMEKVEKYFFETFGRKCGATDYKISGIYRDEFTDEQKNDLRRLVMLENDAIKIADAHFKMIRRKTDKALADAIADEVEKQQPNTATDLRFIIRSFGIKAKIERHPGGVIAVLGKYRRPKNGNAWGIFN